MVTYIKYVAGKTKGLTTNGDLFNDPFRLGNVDPRYTSNSVVETFTASQTALAWAPVDQGTFKKADGTVLGDVKVTAAANGTVYYGTFASADNAKTGTLASMTFVDDTGATATYTLAANDKIAYLYNNIVVPQNDLPMLRAEMESIPLIARAYS